jgi:hypothetical protein
MFSGIAHAQQTLIIDFASGRPPSNLVQISELTPSTGLDFSNGTMNVVMPNPGDGVLIDPITINPVCWVFDNLSITDFPLNGGISFDLIFGDIAEGNSFETRIINSGSVSFELYEKANGQVVRQQTVTLPGDSLPDFRRLRIDWVSRPDPIFPGSVQEFFVLEGRFQNGTRIEEDMIASALRHETALFSRGRIRNITGIPADPPALSMGTMELSDYHVPEPSSIILFGTGALGLLGFGWRRRKRSA